MKSNTRIPSSGKKVSRVSGCKRNSMFNPLCPHPNPLPRGEETPFSNGRRAGDEGKFISKSNTQE
jgi:hypothetical protein